MSAGLRSVLGLPDSAAATGGAPADGLREAFLEAIQLVNEALRSAATHTPPGEFLQADAQRAKLYAAYQAVSRSSGAKEPSAAERVLTAAQALAQRVSARVQQAEASHSRWEAREPDLDGVLSKVAELEDGQHPKAPTLRKLIDVTRQRAAERDYDAALRALDQVAPRVESIHQELTLSAQPATDALDASISSASASSAPSGTRTVPGAGGYEYEQHPDGAIFIVKSPINGSTRIEVERGSTAYNAILEEIGPFPSAAPAPSLPPTPSPGAGAPGPIGDAPLPPEGGGSSPPIETPKSLEALMAKDELTADEIVEARRLIAQEPEAAQGALYELLQEKTAYHNQRNNETGFETSDGGTCNLTAVAMALEFLGVKNPYPQMEFDEALVKIAVDENYGDITSVACWEKVAKKLGVAGVELFASSVKKNRSWWESTVDSGYLKKGYGVVMSLDGHVVRLEAIIDAGLVVDDPYGASKLSGRTFDDNGDGVADRPKYSFTESNSRTNDDSGSSGNAGDDTGYPWADVEKYTFKYLVAFK